MDISLRDSLYEYLECIVYRNHQLCMSNTYHLHTVQHAAIAYILLLEALSCKFYRRMFHLHLPLLVLDVLSRSLAMVTMVGADWMMMMIVILDPLVFSLVSRSSLFLVVLYVFSFFFLFSAA